MLLENFAKVVLFNCFQDWIAVIQSYPGENDPLTRRSPRCIGLIKMSLLIGPFFCLARDAHDTFDTNSLQVKSQVNAGITVADKCQPLSAIFVCEITQMADKDDRR